MIILERYLARAVVGGTLLTLGVLVPLIAFFLLADEIESIGSSDRGLLHALLLMVLALPGQTYQLFPIATLIGALIGLGGLARRSELVAMRAAGISVAQIIRAALLGGLLLAGLGLVLGEVVTPKTEQRALDLRRQTLSSDSSQQLSYGFWAIDSRSYVHIKEISSATRLGDVSIYETDAAAGTLVTTRASSASYSEGEWILEGIARTRVSAEGARVEHLERERWTSRLDPGLIKVVAVDPQVLPVWGLFKYIRFMTLNEQDASSYEIAFWSKVMHPVMTLSMIFVAIPIILASARTIGLGPRIFIGVLGGIIYYVMSRTFGFLALLFSLDPMVAAVIPPAIFGLGALLLLRRIG